MNRCWYVVALLSLLPLQVLARMDEAPLGEAVERHLPGDEQFTRWARDPEGLDAGAGDRLASRDVSVAVAETVKLENVVAPIRFASGVAQVPEGVVEDLRRILDGLRDRPNLRLHLVGHTDNQPLSTALQRRYGDNQVLSRERAGEVAELFQQALDLAPEGVSYEWAGATRPVASNASEAGRARNRRVEVEVWYDVFTDEQREEEYVVTEDIRQIKVCRMETVCKLRYVDGHARRARVQNLIEPLHYEAGSLDVTPAFLQQIQRTLANLSDKRNVAVKFIGHTDDASLAERDARIYGDHLSLSRARAHRVALAVQDRLKLPAAAIESGGYGASRAVASNKTAHGRALNRRIEVEFWYDDALQELPGEPQLCPADTAAETVTRVYDPPWGSLPPVQIDDGQPVMSQDYLDKVRRGLGDVSDKQNARLRFIGYTGNDRLDRRTALIYGDDVGLSAARARRTLKVVAEALELGTEQVEHEGRGYVHSRDVVNAGFVQGEASHVEVQVVYDELAVLDDYEGIEVSPLTRELAPKNPFALNLMRITVDGEPIDDPGHSSADVQRCTDVAMRDRDVSFVFDDLNSAPRLGVAASAQTVAVHPLGPVFDSADPVRFRMYTNYQAFIERAEVRIFDAAASIHGRPLAVVPVGDDGYGAWVPDLPMLSGPMRELKYVLRAFGREGEFDETTSHPLWVMRSASLPGSNLGEVYGTLARAPSERDEASTAARDRSALLTSYGQNSLALQNIPLSSGTVRVQGAGLAADQDVWVAGERIPLDGQGNFVSEALLPKGRHTVEVALLDQEGSGELYLRDLELERSDWFYAGMADVTWSQNHSSDNANLYVGDHASHDFDSAMEGRLAFYATGELGSGWDLTASVDTREGELDTLFSNFLGKEPDALFRRLDPDNHYPTFGDDSTVVELAPTQGKLYLRAGRGDDYGLWGNYQVSYANNELGQVDRGLYGAQLHYQSSATTGFGEQRLSADLFGAEPGTVPSRQEFRGTGGSFYSLRHQDILRGSERLRLEIRDKTSGLVTGVVNLTASVDYDIDYLQGTVILTEPLAGTVSDDLLIRSGSARGDEAYLVVRYEYTPGFDEIDALAMGGQVHYWLNDRIKVGLTANENSNDDSALESGLQAADVTFRLSAESWAKVQSGRSDGLLSQSLISRDGGFEFQGVGTSAPMDGSAQAHRGDVSIDLADLSRALNGQLLLYGQTVEAGYSAPGLEAISDSDTYGGALQMDLSASLSLRTKSDLVAQDQGLEISAHELNVTYTLNPRWDLSAGVRHDRRDDGSGAPLPTQELGSRTDGVVQVGFDSGGRWDAYSYAQDTVSKSDGRRANGRYGMGGSYLVSERLRVDGEVSDGDLGAGGRVGSSYLHSERTSFYVSYVLENERTDNGLRGAGRAEGTLVSGMKTRFSDSTSVFLEERYQHGKSLTGLTHGAGVRLAATEKWNLSASTDIGTLEDRLTGADTDRLAGSVRIGYGSEALQLSTGVEYREDESERLDASRTRRQTWLYRNTLRWQIDPSGRLLGKLNFSTSNSSDGAFFDGRYTEAVLGYAFRPVNTDRLNAMVKYTYLYSVPAADQVTRSETAAEYLQKTHVAAVDATYELTRSWRLGGKYAHRFGQISLDRQDPDFFDNSADLYVVRSDWRVWDDWEVLLEGRLLEMSDLGERRAGGLVAVSRYLGDHFKAGLGYNLTDFSDDLTDLSYDHRGVFLNLTGVF